MTSLPRIAIILCWGLALSLAGCGRRGLIAGTTGNDAGGADTQADRLGGGALDGAVDVVADGAVDVRVDRAPDAAIDQAADLAPDLAPDLARDLAPDLV